MRVTERRTMIYLPDKLYRSCAATARRKGASMASVVREALEVYLARPEEEALVQGVEACFGLWKGRVKDGRDYEEKLRKPLKKRQEDLRRDLAG